MIRCTGLHGLDHVRLRDIVLVSVECVLARELDQLGHAVGLDERTADGACELEHCITSSLELLIMIIL